MSTTFLLSLGSYIHDKALCILSILSFLCLISLLLTDKNNQSDELPAVQAYCA